MKTMARLGIAGLGLVGAFALGSGSPAVAGTPVTDVCKPSGCLVSPPLPPPCFTAAEGTATSVPTPQLCWPPPCITTGGVKPPAVLGPQVCLPQPCATTIGSEPSLVPRTSGPQCWLPPCTTASVADATPATKCSYPPPIVPAR